MLEQKMLSLPSKARGKFRIFITVPAKNGVTSRHASVRLSPHFPLIPVELEAWKLACIFLTWMAPKFTLHFIAENSALCKNWTSWITREHTVHAAYKPELQFMNLNIWNFIFQGSLGRVRYFSPHKKYLST